MSGVSSYRPCAGCDEPCGCPLTAVPSGPRDDRAEERELLVKALDDTATGIYMGKNGKGWGANVTEGIWPVVDQIAEARAVARAQQELRAAAKAEDDPVSASRLYARADALGGTS